MRKRILDEFGNPASDSYCTPEWLCNLLPPVSLDPCSNPRSKINAKRTYSLEGGQDGLSLPWKGDIFCNPPYSDVPSWVDKARFEYRKKRLDSAIFLVKADSSTQWWTDLTGICTNYDLWLFTSRLNFDRPTLLTGENSSNNFCSAIIQFGNYNSLSHDLNEYAQLYRRICVL